MEVGWQLNPGTSDVCFCQDQRKDRQATIEKLLLLIDSTKSWINQRFLCIIFSEYLFSRSMNFVHIWLVFIFANAA